MTCPPYKTAKQSIYGKKYELFPLDPNWLDSKIYDVQPTEVNFSAMLWFRCDEIIGGTSLGIAFIAVALGGYFFYNDVQPFADVEQFCRLFIFVKIEVSIGNH